MGRLLTCITRSSTCAENWDIIERIKKVFVYAGSRGKETHAFATVTKHSAHSVTIRGVEGSEERWKNGFG